MTTQRDHAATELERALRSGDDFDRWLLTRGYAPADEVIAPDRASLSGVRPMATVDADLTHAPRLLVLWRDDLTRRALHGSALRRLQKDAVHFRERVVVHGDAVQAPDLFFLACPHFLMVFPLGDDPFARRQRFTVEQLRHSATLGQRFAALSAPNMARWASEPAGGDAADSWADLDLGERSFDWEKHLYGGGRLDEEFVAFMGQERRRLVEAALDPGRDEALLLPMLVALGADAAGGDPGGVGRVPTGPELVRDPALRKQVVAVVDTVLLRLVLYRYLEAQFADVDPDERRGIGFGTWDQLVDRTADVSQERHAALVKQARLARQNAARQPVKTPPVKTTGPQLDLFGVPEPSVQVHDADAFVEGVKAAGAYYQSSAGGDLHRGQLARAANVLQDHLLADPALRDAFATLIEGTRSTRYSFNYEDLDPRAFQRFYEDTIGTDIGFSVDDGRVRVVPRMRNRKEQGAYFTDERVCRWLVERTLGKWFEEAWLPGLLDLLPLGERRGPAVLPALEAHLDRLLGLRVIDPTCGGGIFLRAAFEFLSRKREVVSIRLEDGLTPEATAALNEKAPYAHLLPDAHPGAWEWHLLLHVLYGVDIDIKAINIASNLLTLSALTYRPKGLCFPSFINTNLKRGNALVTPLAEEERAAFLARWRDELVGLMALRGRLRDPELAHDEWEALHQEVVGRTRAIVEAEVGRAWRGVFGDGALQDRVDRVGVFLYEVEFPEVFFTADGRLRADAGFDVVVGNPPWEAPAKQLKQFLPEYDPDYRELSQARAIEAEERLLVQPAIAAAWERFQANVEDYRTLLGATPYRHQSRRVRGKIRGNQNNLYAYAVETAWHVLKEDGAAGLVLDGGLWNDLSCAGLRALLLDEGRLEVICGFNNNLGLFPDVHRSYKFGCFVYRRGGRTESFRGVFMRTTFDDLDTFDQHAVTLEAAVIRADRRESYPIPEIRSTEHWQAERGLSVHPLLDDPEWATDTYSRELHAADQRHYFHAEPREGWLPLAQGAQFNHWGVHEATPPEAWVDPADTGAGGFLRSRQEGRILAAIAEHIGAASGKEAAAREWLRALTGQPEVPAEWVRLDWDGYRLAWRNICRNDDRRTLIAGIVPRRVALTDKAPFVRPFRMEVTGDGLRWTPQYPPAQLCYLAGMLSSYVCDAVTRSRLAKTDLKLWFFLGLPVPPWRDTPAHYRIAELTARLTCRPATPERPWADYTDLAVDLGLTPERDALLDPTARRDAEVELNAHACALYGLDRDAFRFLMTTLFDTPRHRDTHFEMRDAILAHGWRLGGRARGA